MRTLVVFAAVLVAAHAASNPLGQEWEQFKLVHNKHYVSESEEVHRFKIFAENKKKISEHNSRYNLGLTSFKLGVSKFADWSHEEFVRIMNGYKATKSNIKKSMYIPKGNPIPDVKNWTAEGAVTPVKNQGYCGSCWAFSATGSMEGQEFIVNKALVSLSEQELVDCSTENNGCSGGISDLAFQYVIENKGLDTEAAYPYIGVEDTCHADSKAIGTIVTNYTVLTSGDIDELQDAVVNIGPISVGMDASVETFQLYSGGIYNDQECTSDKLDHGVLVVGYGTENGIDYWLVKNSWGTDWGEYGYFRILRKDNLCGIATHALYPTAAQK